MRSFSKTENTLILNSQTHKILKLAYFSGILKQNDQMLKQVIKLKSKVDVLRLIYIIYVRDSIHDAQMTYQKLYTLQIRFCNGAH